MKSIISLVVAWLAATVIAQSDESGKYEAIFFYYAYANDWMMHPGNNTIGGRKCRRKNEPCAFDEWLDANIKSGGSKGGYNGIWNPSTQYDFNIGDAFGIGRRLEFQCGLNKKIDWDLQQLVIDAPKDKKLYWDHITYVINAFSKDADKKGSVKQFVNIAADALRLMNDIVVSDDYDTLKEWIGDKAPSGMDIDTLDLPLADADPGENIVRTAIDFVAVGTKWFWDVPGLIPKDLYPDFPRSMRLRYYGGLLRHQLSCKWKTGEWKWPAGWDRPIS